MYNRHEKLRSSISQEDIPLANIIPFYSKFLSQCLLQLRAGWIRILIAVRNRLRNHTLHCVRHPQRVNIHGKIQLYFIIIDISTMRFGHILFLLIDYPGIPHRNPAAHSSRMHNVSHIHAVRYIRRFARGISSYETARTGSPMNGFFTTFPK